MSLLWLTTNIQPCKSGGEWRFWVRRLNWGHIFGRLGICNWGVCFSFLISVFLPHVMTSMFDEQNNMFFSASFFHWGKLFRCIRSMCLGRTLSSMRMAARVHVQCMSEGGGKREHTAKKNKWYNTFLGLHDITQKVHFCANHAPLKLAPHIVSSARFKTCPSTF